MDAPLCSLVVPVHNGLSYLEPMLRTLREHTQVGLYELFLSDDASDETTRAFLSQVPDAQVHFSSENRGFAAACNAGARLASGELLVFLNTDLEFRPGWLEALAAAAEPGIDAVGCKLLYPDGTIQHGGVFLREDRLDRVPLVASHDRAGAPGDDPEANRKQDLLAVTAAAMLVRREAFEAVGGFDEAYVNGYEDIDLCLKLRERGGRVVYEPACELIHFESKSGAKRFAASKANQRRFLAKWVGRVRPEVVVTEHLDVRPHPDAEVAHPFYSFVKKETYPSVRIVVPSNGHTAAFAATLESVFGARVGLEDRVVAVAANDDDARYLELCQGHDDAFEWTRDLETALKGSEDFVAWIEPGIMATQGWLSRLLLHMSEGASAAGPLMTGVQGPQNVLSQIAEGSSGHFHPNDLTHLLARQRANQFLTGVPLTPDCFLTRREFVEMVRSRKPLERSRVALDVFVHREGRFDGVKVLSAAA